MIDENKDCATKSKLRITVRTPSKYEMNKVQAIQTKKQTQRN